MKLLALSDLHVGDPRNRAAVEGMRARKSDWLILGGDLGETPAQLEHVLRTLTPKFAKLIWVPGNHELWTTRDAPDLRGEAKYLWMVDVCRSFGVLTPEDPYPVWPGDGPPCVIAPLFLLYDYSFRPDDVPREGALDWALEAGICCVDEQLLDPTPYASRDAWCHARCELSARRLAAIDPSMRTVLVNHYPLRRDHAILPAIPRFSIWCGTRITEDWHRRFRAIAVVGGHLHLRARRVLDGVRFEEVSLGYARQWSTEQGIDAYVRTILPEPEPAPTHERWGISLFR